MKKRSFKNTKYRDLTGVTYNGDIDISDMKLTSLEGAPKIVHGFFNCAGNELKSLEGGPEIVEKHFDCYNNSLVSLKGIPKKIGDVFYCYANPNLTQEAVWVLLDSNIKGTITLDNGLTAPTKDDYILYNKLHKDMKKFLKIKELKAKLK